MTDGLPTPVTAGMEMEALHAAAVASLASLEQTGSAEIALPGRTLQLSLHEDSAWLTGELALAQPLDDVLFARLCAMALPASAHHAASLSYSHAAAALRFVRRLPARDRASLLHEIEAMLNQIDAWLLLLTSAPAGGRAC
ncbi:hypothetical protein ACN9MU_21035 [Pseudoduganella sp. R-32]|uniref:hypothetical protein n=1 Tax=Pseudoduganella sp. R-32 TaxID=3404061 RepID=UPI003CF9A004